MAPENKPGQPTKPKAAVITISDRCSLGLREDISGPKAVELIEAAGFETLPIKLVPDDVAQIQTAIKTAIVEGARYIFTTGGTGISPKDFTPEATSELLAVELPGIAEKIRRVGEAKTPMAAVSRGLVGVTSRGADAAVIVNAPGSVGGVKDCASVMNQLIGHLLDQIAGQDH